MTYDLYAWHAPRDLDIDGAEALLERWQASGGDPATSPFDPSTDVGWFHRELMRDVPGLDAISDAVPNPSTSPVWLSGKDEPPARIVAMRLSPATRAEGLDSIFGLAAKYDLVLFDARNRRLHLPLEELAAYASATFWPAGAIRSAVAGAIGALIAVVAWAVGIPLLSGLLVVVGGFLVVLAVYGFVHEGRIALRRPRSGGDPPPSS